MCTTLITEFSLCSSELSSKGTDLNDQKDLVAKAIVANPESFECAKEGNSFIWTLRPAIIDQYLLNFLQRYYHDFYGQNSEAYKKYALPLINYLSTNPTSKVLQDWNEDMQDDNITFDHDEIRQVTINRNQINVRTVAIMLTSEGKIIFEELEEHMDFFEKSIRETYSDDALGGGIMVVVG
jgi:hypothetical protein